MEWRERPLRKLLQRPEPSEGSIAPKSSSPVWEEDGSRLAFDAETRGVNSAWLSMSGLISEGAPMRKAKGSSNGTDAIKRLVLRQRLAVIAGVVVAAGGAVIFILHNFGIALTDHPWFTIGQLALIAGVFFVLWQIWGAPKRSRR